jgi:hypothetical protein
MIPFFISFFVYICFDPVWFLTHSVVLVDCFLLLHFLSLIYLTCRQEMHIPDKMTFVILVNRMDRISLLRLGF